MAKFGFKAFVVDNDLVVKLKEPAQVIELALPRRNVDDSNNILLNKTPPRLHRDGVSFIPGEGIRT